MQKHLQAELRHPVTGRPSIAYWAFAPTRTLIVFVHGFGGNAVGTWKEFDQRLPTRADHDLLFFGYDGLFRHATESAIDLFGVLDDLGTKPQRVFQESRPQPLPRGAAFAYDRIVIAAHSLGAVVARHALLQAHTEAKAWLQRVRLVLFAPAHNGTRVGALFTEAVTGLSIPGVTFIGAAAKGAYRAFTDLLEGSPILTTLRSDVATALAAGANIAAHTVVWADNDPVVVNGPFPGDPAPRPKHRLAPPAFGHTSVCKPNPGFPAPLYILLGAVS